MRELVVNARFLSQPITGVQRFAIEVSRELLKSEIPVRFLCPKNSIHHEIAEEFKAEKCGTLSGTAWEQIDLPRMLKKQKKPLLLNLANTGPLAYRNQALVLHDLAFLVHPEWFSKKFVFWYRFLIPNLLQKAKIIFTVSEFSKNEITRFWPGIEGRVFVAGNGLPGLNAGDEAATNLPENPYILCVSGNNRRKNGESVMEAMNLLNEPGLRLLMLGRRNENFRTPSRIGNAPSMSPKIEFLEDVSDTQLASLYQHAEALVYPSSYEGFGLPPLEALSYNCPSILTDIPVFKEIYEGAALFIPDAKPEHIAKGIEQIRHESGLKETIISRGKDVVERHSFKKVCERMIQRLFPKEQGKKNPAEK